MARLEVSGLDDLTVYLKQQEQLTGQMARDMLDSGADVLVKVWKNKIKKKNYIDSGDMLKSVKAKKTKEGDDGFLEKTVYPQGKDKRGTRNAEKAFLLHYGWKTNAATNGPHDGDHFVDEIEQEAAPNVVSAMEQTMADYLKKGQ